jgi:large subunit ribosomal protein L28
MSRVCQFCGKRVQVGNSIARRGLAKPKGGIGLKTTGVTRRRFKPNIQSVRAFLGGRMQRVRVCTRCIKSGKVNKGLKKKVPATT